MKAKIWFALGAMLVLLVAACGGDDDSPNAEIVEAIEDAQAAVQDSGSLEDAQAAVEDLADDLTESLEQAQAASGGGGATLTVGDQTWTFDSVLCAFGEDQIGQAGAEFNMSSIEDGLQFYVSIDSFGDSVSLDDISDFTNPSVSLSSFGNATINLDGKSFSGEGGFLDGTSDTFEEIPGTFSGTCP